MQFDAYLKNIQPIKVKIIDDEINYYQSEQFIKDSLEKLKIQPNKE